MDRGRLRRDARGRWEAPDQVQLGSEGWMFSPPRESRSTPHPQRFYPTWRGFHPLGGLSVHLFTGVSLRPPTKRCPAGVHPPGTCRAPDRTGPAPGVWSCPVTDQLPRVSCFRRIRPRHRTRNRHRTNDLRSDHRSHRCRRRSRRCHSPPTSCRPRRRRCRCRCRCPSPRARPGASSSGCPPPPARRPARSQRTRSPLRRKSPPTSRPSIPPKRGPPASMHCLAHPRASSRFPALPSCVGDAPVPVRPKQT